MRIFYIIVFCLLLVDNANSQDVEFSQFNSSSTYLNPSLTGYKGCNCITSTYRNQWPDIPNSYNTQFFSYERKLQKYNAGIGGYLLNDIAGEGSLKRQSIVFLYSKQMRLSKNLYASFGIKGGYTLNSINWNQLTWGDMIDARKGFVYATNQPYKPMNTDYFDTGTGAIIYTKIIYLGFAFEHINRPQDKLLASHHDTRIPVRYKGHIGGKFKLSSYPNRPQIFMSPQLIYTRQNQSQQFTYGSYFTYKDINAGILLRQNESLIFLVGAEKNNFRVNYSFDLGVNELMNYTGGAHELSINYIIKCSDHQGKKKYKTLSCPLFN